MSDCGARDTEPSSSSRRPGLVAGQVARVLRGDVVDEHGLAMLDAPDGELVLVRRVPRVRRVALALLDGEAVLDLLLLGVVEPHAEHGGVGELVHALVEPEEDGVEVERRGDLLADVAQQLDVRHALAFGRGPASRPTPRAAALPGGATSPAPSRSPAGAGRDRRRRRRRQQREIEPVRPPRRVPGRKDRERVDRLAARPGRRGSWPARGNV